MARRAGLARHLALDHNPLRRRADRLETCIMAGLLAAFLAGARAACRRSGAKITAAAYRRRDSSQAGNSTCVRPQPRQIPRRGCTTTGPANVAISRGRACPHGRSVPPHQQASRPHLSRASTDFPEPRTVITVVPPAPLGRPSRYPGQKIREGRCLCRHGHGDAVHQPPPAT